MTSHLHFHPHLPGRSFAMEHPYAPDWAILGAVTMTALVLWFWNS